MLSIEVYKRRLTQLKNKFGKDVYCFNYLGECWWGKITNGMTPVQFYYYYMHSNKWREVKLDRMRRDNFMCKKCGSKNNLTVHHETYCNFSFESYDDLITLCEKCHTKKHIKDYIMSRYHPELIPF